MYEIVLWCLSLPNRFLDMSIGLVLATQTILDCRWGDLHICFKRDQKYHNEVIAEKDAFSVFDGCFRGIELNGSKLARI